jgi:hypothetical protein
MAECDKASAEAIEGASDAAWLYDLLHAAGGDEQHIRPDVDGLSLDGVRLLSQVWEGNRYSVRELAAAMEQMERQQ